MAFQNSQQDAVSIKQPIYQTFLSTLGVSRDADRKATYTTVATSHAALYHTSVVPVGCVILLHVLVHCDCANCSLLPVLLLQLHAMLAIASAAANLAILLVLQQQWLVTVHVCCLAHLPLNPGHMLFGSLLGDGSVAGY